MVLDLSWVRISLCTALTVPSLCTLVLAPLAVSFITLTFPIGVKTFTLFTHVLWLLPPKSYLHKILANHGGFDEKSAVQYCIAVRTVYIS